MTQSTRQKQSQTWLGFTSVFLLFCGLIGFITTIGSAILFRNSAQAKVYEVVDTNHPYASSAMGSQAAVSPLSPVFTPEIQYWGPLIKAWAIAYQIDPNLIATVIQIESCGDPTITSNAGAQGLFQVMPFHFATGEDMVDVQTNATRGLDYLLGSLQVSDGHVGLALAGYNGGHGVINRGWAAWSEETQRYYYWGSRIYFEAVSGMDASPTLQEWLNAGGTNLCARANQSLKQLEAQQASAAVASN
jgi:soluble lytic murein transglycosylase-like protein